MLLSSGLAHLVLKRISLSVFLSTGIGTAFEAAATKEEHKK